MPRETVVSSVVGAVDYDAVSQHLHIEFTTGRVYRYLDVPPDTFGAFMAAESKGRFYNDHIRDVFLCIHLR